MSLDFRNDGEETAQAKTENALTSEQAIQSAGNHVACATSNDTHDEKSEKNQSPSDVVRSDSTKSAPKKIVGSEVIKLLERQGMNLSSGLKRLQEENPLLISKLEDELNDVTVSRDETKLLVAGLSELKRSTNKFKNFEAIISSVIFEEQKQADSKLRLKYLANLVAEAKGEGAKPRTIDEMSKMNSVGNLLRAYPKIPVEIQFDGLYDLATIKVSSTENTNGWASLEESVGFFSSLEYKVALVRVLNVLEGASDEERELIATGKMKCSDLSDSHLNGLSNWWKEKIRRGKTIHFKLKEARWRDLEDFTRIMKGLKIGRKPNVGVSTIGAQSKPKAESIPAPEQKETSATEETGLQDSPVIPEPDTKNVSIKLSVTIPSGEDTHEEPSGDIQDMTNEVGDTGDVVDLVEELLQTLAKAKGRAHKPNSGILAQAIEQAILLIEDARKQIESDLASEDVE